MKSIESVPPAVEYKAERTPDDQYKTLLKCIRETGKRAVSGMDSGSTEILGYTLRYDLSNGFPLITERDLTRGTTPEIIANYTSKPEKRVINKTKNAFAQGIGETIGFMNGARTQEELEAYGCNFWKPWTSDQAKADKRGLKLGDLGPGSYGAAFHDFPTAEGGTFNQVEAMIQQINNRPELRTHLITPYIPQYITRAPGYQQKVLVVPCHGMQHYNIDVENREISLLQWQRSADVPVGLPFNIAGYAANLMMVAQVTGYKPRELVMQLSNPHIYDQHLEKVDEIIERPSFAFPKVTIDPTIKNIEDFRPEHFTIEEYYAHPPIDMGGTPV